MLPKWTSLRNKMQVGADACVEQSAMDVIKASFGTVYRASAHFLSMYCTQVYYGHVAAHWLHVTLTLISISHLHGAAHGLALILTWTHLGIELTA